MISKKAKYALKALRVLTRRYDTGEPVLIATIADEERIPRKFLETILLELRNHGLLKSHQGKRGGYRLHLPPGEVTFARVLRLVDGPLAPTRCVSLYFYERCEDCADERTCSLRATMEGWRDANLAVLEKKSLLDLM